MQWWCTFFRGFHARCARHPRLPWVYTHGCVMPPLRGSIIFSGIPWVPRTMCASPTSVLCHRHAVLCYVTATRFECFFRLSVGFAHDVPWVTTASPRRNLHSKQIDTNGIFLMAFDIFCFKNSIAHPCHHPPKTSHSYNNDDCIDQKPNKKIADSRHLFAGRYYVIRLQILDFQCHTEIDIP